MKTLTAAQQIKVAQKAEEYGKSLIEKGYTLDKVCSAVWNKYGYPMNVKNGKATILVNGKSVATF